MSNLYRAPAIHYGGDTIRGHAGLRANSAALIRRYFNSSARCSPGCIAVSAMLPEANGRRKERAHNARNPGEILAAGAVHRVSALERIGKQKAHPPVHRKAERDLPVFLVEIADADSESTAGLARSSPTAADASRALMVRCWS